MITSWWYQPKPMIIKSRECLYALNHGTSKEANTKPLRNLPEIKRVYSEGSIQKGSALVLQDALNTLNSIGKNKKIIVYTSQSYIQL